MTLTVRVKLPDDGLYDSGALGDMSPAYWHAVTGGITHRASPPYSHVSGHAGAAGRVCGRPTALATGITGIIGGERCSRRSVGGGGGVVLLGQRTLVQGRLLARRRRRRSANERVPGVAAMQLARGAWRERRRVGVARHCSCRRPPKRGQRRDAAAVTTRDRPRIVPNDLTLLCARVPYI